MVQLRTTPWTQEGRSTAIQKGVAAVYERYFSRGPRWVAKHLPERTEMPQWSGNLGKESREMLLGDFGIESFIDDYAQLVIHASGDSLSTRQVYTQWIFDETRHSRALWYCLSDSGLYSKEALNEYMYQSAQDVWTFERQTGYEGTPERAAAYAIAQERQTKRSYQKQQRRIWEEYGSPMDGQNRPVYPAIAGVCRRLATDEGFHEGVFREVTRVYLHFWPDKALQAMWEVYEKYRMVIVKLPNAEAFMDAVLSTGTDSIRAVASEVLQPTYEAMGLESRSALRRAARESWDMPDGAVVQIGDEPLPGSEGAIPYRLNADGSLVPVSAAAGA